MADTKDLEAICDAYMAALQAGPVTENYERRMFEWIMEWRFGEGIWETINGIEDARKVAEKEAKDQAEIERKARIKADVEAKEAEAGKTIDEMAQIVAAYNKVQESLRQKEIGAELEKQKAAQKEAAPVVEVVSKNSKAAK